MKRGGYSLIELAVVLAVIALMGAATLPSFYNNSRNQLDSAANVIKQQLVDARVKSLAPNKNDGPQTAQVYQVALSNFPISSGQTPTPQPNVAGDINTNSSVLQRGLATCGQNATQASFTTVRSYKLPRGVYVSSFYPYDTTPNESGAVVRFTVGQLGFSCGKSSDPAIKSASFGIDDAFWAGTNNTRSRYLVIELSSTGSSEKRYIAVDRLTSEVSVSRTNPQQNFVPVTDSLSPRWRLDSTPPVFTPSFSCTTIDNVTTATFSYRRADDRYDSTDLNKIDANRLVYYDISWSLGNQDSYQPIAIKYFANLSNDTITYVFTTNAISQQNNIYVRVVASDERGNPQGSPPPTNGQDVWKDLSFGKPSSFGWCNALVSDDFTNGTFNGGGVTDGVSPIGGISRPPTGP